VNVRSNLTTGVTPAEHLDAELAEHAAVAARTRESLATEFPRLVAACADALQSGHKLLLFGNGGAAAAAQHIATELVVRYNRESGSRRPMAALALTTDTSALTAIGNDFGFDDLYSRQVEALCQAGDVAIGISTSGNSENVIRGLLAARARGAITVGFAGEGGGRLAELVDHRIFVPSASTARVQEMHMVIGHALCSLLEKDANR
jgi:D-sedoheptulose 7-phosphate isomerase